MDVTYKYIPNKIKPIVIIIDAKTTINIKVAPKIAILEINASPPASGIIILINLWKDLITNSLMSLLIIPLIRIQEKPKLEINEKNTVNTSESRRAILIKFKIIDTNADEKIITFAQ